MAMPNWVMDAEDIVGRAANFAGAFAKHREAEARKWLAPELPMLIFAANSRT